MEKVYIENDLYLAVNEDGDITADMDRDAAVKRMEEEYGGNDIVVVTVRAKVERRPDALLDFLLNNGETEGEFKAA